MMPGKDFYCKVKLQNSIIVGIIPPSLFLFISLPPPGSPDRGPPKNRQKPWNDAGFPFDSQAASWVTAIGSRSNHTHADSLIDSTEEESMVSALCQLPCWRDWLTLWSSGGPAIFRICSHSTGGLINGTFRPAGSKLLLLAVVVVVVQSSSWFLFSF